MSTSRGKKQSRKERSSDAIVGARIGLDLRSGTSIKDEPE